MDHIRNEYWYLGKESETQHQIKYITTGKL
jgi:hypothetical protein